MAKDFFAGTTFELRWAVAGFFIAAVGVGLGFLGFAVSIRDISVLGFWICVSGVAIGFLAVGLGVLKWLRHGRRNLAASAEASRELHDRLWKSKSH